MMQFQPSKILTEDQWQYLQNEYLGYNQDECIDLGSLDFLSVSNFIVGFFELWTAQIDKKVKASQLLLDEKYSELYRRLIYERGLTYNEFMTLFDGEIEEEEYPHYPAYEFLQITTKEERKYLVNKYERNVESYCKLIEDSKLMGAAFFLKRLKSQLPVSSLKKHCYIIGKTGSGKSMLMLTIFYHLQKLSDKKQHYSLVLLDPHGDLANEVVSLHLNQSNPDRLLYINPCLAKGYATILNPFDLKDKSDEAVELMAQILVDVFRVSGRFG